MITKETYTKIFLSELGISADSATVALYMQKLWYSRRTKKTGGLRLSQEGYELLLTDLDLKDHEVPFSDHIELSPQIIVFLDQYLTCPYFLTNKGLYVFSEKEAFKLHMFSDDIRKLGLVKAMTERKSEIN